MSSEPPKRNSSLEMTAVRPRPELRVFERSADDVIGPTIEQLADVERARRDLEDETPTLDSCPAAGCADCVTCNGRHSVECGECGAHSKDCPGTCSTCAVCLGTHMISRDDYAAWRRENPEPGPDVA